MLFTQFQYYLAWYRDMSRQLAESAATGDSTEKKLATLIDYWVDRGLDRKVLTEMCNFVGQDSGVRSVK